LAQRSENMCFNQYPLCFVLLFGLWSCTSGGGSAEGEALPPLADSEPLPVQTMRLEPQAFLLRYYANGHLQAGRQAEISMGLGGVLAAAPMQEGGYVEAGAALAQLDPSLLYLKLEQAQLALAEAEVNKKDLLLANGGQAEDDSSVSPEKLRLILTLSGYDKARHAIKLAEHELAQAVARAPFSGVVANIDARPFQQVAAGQRICTLFDPASYEAVFRLLETEAAKVKPGQPVTVQPTAQPGLRLKGQISALNPVVDEQGLVMVRAKLLDAARVPGLLLGMNLQVAIEQELPAQLVIPKSAVVLRSGREVVFTYEPREGRAKWKYVTVAQVNDTQAAIAEGLEAGEEVIVEGHLNLGHDARVAIRQ
jgi:RND family efflux transporter MFP subunit